MCETFACPQSPPNLGPVHSTSGLSSSLFPLDDGNRARHRPLKPSLLLLLLQVLLRHVLMVLLLGVGVAGLGLFAMPLHCQHKFKENIVFVHHLCEAQKQFVALLSHIYSVVESKHGVVDNSHRN